MTKPAPMTAEEMQALFRKQLQTVGTVREYVSAVATVLAHALHWMSAREAHDAEIAALKAQIGELGKRMEDDGR